VEFQVVCANDCSFVILMYDVLMLFRRAVQK